jgi:hypothetical protein
MVAEIRWFRSPTAQVTGINMVSTMLVQRAET